MKGADEGEAPAEDEKKEGEGEAKDMGMDAEM